MNADTERMNPKSQSEMTRISANGRIQDFFYPRLGVVRICSLKLVPLMVPLSALRIKDEYVSLVELKLTRKPRCLG